MNSNCRLFMFLIFVALYFSGSSAIAQDLPDWLKAEKNVAPIQKTCNHAHHKKSNQISKIQSEQAGKYEYDVISMDLYMDWVEIFRAEKVTNDMTFTGINNIKLVSLVDDLSEIRLNKKNIIVDKVLLNNIELNTENEVLEEVFVVKLQEPLKTNDTVTLNIYYTREFKGNSPGFSDGFYLYDKNSITDIYYDKEGEPIDTIYSPHRIAYTQSEPIEARSWMPCKDVPDDKFMSTVKVKVPEGITPVSNGILKETTIEGDDVIFYWENQFPINTYLMAVTASEYVYFSDEYVTPDRTIPINYYVWNEDLDGTGNDYYNAKEAFASVPAMFDVFTKTYTDYPYESYGMVSVGPYFVGGMEHQTMSSVNRNWLSGYSEDGIAHELAHQWLGNMVTCEEWNEIWINEGGATYGEQLWNEFGNNDVNFTTMFYDGLRYKYFDNRFKINTPIRSLNVSTIFLSTTNHLVYYKSGWVYHMLRMNIGDSLFFAGMKNLLLDNAYGNADYEKFKNAFKKLDNVDHDFIDMFLDQWLNYSGHPVFSIDWSKNLTDDDKYRVEVQLTQIQERLPEVYQSVAHLIVSNDELKKRENFEFYIDEKTENLEYVVDFEPTSVMINERTLLCEQELVTSVPEISEFESEEDYKIYPNPAYLGNTVFQYLNLSNSSNVQITLFGHNGNKIREIYSSQLMEGNYKFSIKTDDLNSGFYYTRILIDGAPYINKLILQN